MLDVPDLWRELWVMPTVDLRTIKFVGDNPILHDDVPAVTTMVLLQFDEPIYSRRLIEWLRDIQDEGCPLGKFIVYHENQAMEWRKSLESAGEEK
jgi:hypothetical protein